MRWFEKQRQEWIKNRINQRRKINRKDIAEKFDVTVLTASQDIQKFISLNPGVLQYDTKAKTYRKSK